MSCVPHARSASARISVLLLLGFDRSSPAGCRQALPASFLPDEDQGYFFVRVQLPDAASLQRTDEVRSRFEKICSKRRLACSHYTTVVGFSLLSGVQNYLQRLLLRHAQGVERAQGPGGAVRRRSWRT